MHAGNIQADLLETARALFLRDPDQFSVAALCRETGLSRTKMRQHFSTKAMLMTALLEKPPAAPKAQHKAKPKAVMTRLEPIPEAEPKPSTDVASEPEATLEVEARPAAEIKPEAKVETKAEIVGEGWIERRFRVFERALSLLETKSEDSAVEQSRTLALVEERLSGPVAASPAELPPIVVEAKMQPVLGAALPPEAVVTAPDSKPYVQPEPLVIPKFEFRQAPPAFHAREKFQTILEKVPAAEIPEAVEKPKLLKDVPAWLLMCAGFAAVALIASAALVFSNSKPVSVARITQTHAAAMAQKYDQGPRVVVIDATGAKAAVPDVVARAEHGDAHAKVDAALAYLRGDGVEADMGAAMRWIQTAALQGDANAQFILGSLYAKGMAPSPERAVKWYEAAAAQGNVKAMHNLASAYLSGEGVAKNSATAIEWFTKAANGGYADAAMNLAVLYDRGDTVGRSPEEALHWYDSAAAMGDPEAAQRAKILRAQMARVAGR